MKSEKQVLLHPHWTSQHIFMGHFLSCTGSKCETWWVLLFVGPCIAKMTQSLSPFSLVALSQNHYWAYDFNLTLPWKYHLYLLKHYDVFFQPNYAHTTAAVLLWYVHNLVESTLLFLKKWMGFCYVLIMDSPLVVSGTAPWPACPHSAHSSITHSGLLVLIVSCLMDCYLTLSSLT